MLRPDLAARRRVAAPARAFRHQFGRDPRSYMSATLGGSPSRWLRCYGPEEFESPMYLAEKVGRAAFVAAISSYGRSQLYLRCTTGDWPKIHVVRCGVEPAFYGEAGPGARRDHRLVCVGRLCEAKGQLLLVGAVAQLRSNGVDVELVLAGDGPLRGEIEASIKRLGLGEHIRITGWISSDGGASGDSWPLGHWCCRASPRACQSSSWKR